MILISLLYLLCLALYFQIDTMDQFLDPKGSMGTSQLMFYYQEPEEKDHHGKLHSNARRSHDQIHVYVEVLFPLIC